ncbi:plant invertase/pectin methylesterase inhibitor superfamily [Carex rostrata]
MASLSPLLKLSLLFFFLSLLYTPIVSIKKQTTTLHTSSTNKSQCQSTPYPSACLSSMELSIPLNIDANFLSLVFKSLLSAMSTTSSLSHLLAAVSHSPYLVETQRGAVQDCLDLHAATISSLFRTSDFIKSSSPDKFLPAIRTHLSAALTNKVTCLEGLAGATGPMKNSLLSSLLSAYQPISNALSLMPKGSAGRPEKQGRRLSDFPAWVPLKDRRLLQSNDDGSDNGDDDNGGTGNDDNGDGDNGYDQSSTITVAKDGTGNFATISDAIAFAPNNSNDRVIISVRAGVYEENVVIDSYKTNIMLIGDGSDVTVITGSRSAGDGWTTFRTATVAVSGEGFLARDLTIKNTAGPAKAQAVALRVNADLVALYRCTIDGYQDTLYVHSFRQFYRECNILGTIDFICGNAAVVFQGCNIIAKAPLAGQYNVITAQSRDDPDEATGISIQNCSIVASEDLALAGTETYLGRPWRTYSTTVYIESFLDGLVHPAGWAEWSGTQGLDTLYYGEYMNTGPGSNTDARVTWPGYHIMDYDDATHFSASYFIYGDDWLGPTSIPYDEQI